MVRVRDPGSTASDPCPLKVMQVSQIPRDGAHKGHK